MNWLPVVIAIAQKIAADPNIQAVANEFWAWLLTKTTSGLYKAPAPHTPPQVIADDLIAEFKATLPAAKTP